MKPHYSIDGYELQDGFDLYRHSVCKTNFLLNSCHRDRFLNESCPYGTLKYGNKVEFVLFLCGYFDSGYLGFEASEGIDWIWEHRVEDFKKLGI